MGGQFALIQVLAKFTLNLLNCLVVQTLATFLVNKLCKLCGKEPLFGSICFIHEGTKFEF